MISIASHDEFETIVFGRSLVLRVGMLCDFDKEDFKEPPKKAKGKGGKESNRVKAVCFTNINGQDL